MSNINVTPSPQRQSPETASVLRCRRTSTVSIRQGELEKLQTPLNSNFLR